MLIEPKQSRPTREQRIVAQHFCENILPHHALQPGSWRFGLDQRARAFYDAAILDAARTRRLTGAAIEAAVDVGDERLGNRQLPLVHLSNLVDAPARRIHLRSQHAIGGARVQTQPAMDAGRVKVPARTVCRCGFHICRMNCHPERSPPRRAESRDLGFSPASCLLPPKPRTFPDSKYSSDPSLASPLAGKRYPTTAFPKHQSAAWLRLDNA